MMYIYMMYLLVRMKVYLGRKVEDMFVDRQTYINLISGMIDQQVKTTEFSYERIFQCFTGLTGF